MARVGGRNAVFAWFVGIVSLAAVGVLVWLALPLVAPSAAWVGTAVGGLGGGASAVDADDESATSGPVSDCRGLYPEALWSYLTQASGGDPVQDASAPVTSAMEFAAALAPEVRFTCAWSSDSGTISTTVAAVGPDAGAIAVSALPSLGFTCDSPEGVQTGRVRCFRDDENGGEQIDLAGGVWVSSSLAGWEPERYASRVAERALAPEE